MNTDDVEVVGKAALSLQEKSKIAMKRIVGETDQMNELAKDVAIELQ